MKLNQKSYMIFFPFHHICASLSLSHLSWEDHCLPLRSLFLTCFGSFTVHSCILSPPFLLGGLPYIHVLRLATLDFPGLLPCSHTPHPIPQWILSALPSRPVMNLTNSLLFHHYQINPSHDHLLPRLL